VSVDVWLLNSRRLMVSLDPYKFIENIIRHVPVSMFYAKILECLMVFLNLYKFLIILSDRVRSRRFGPKF
jgi:hypothetical protein